MAQIAPQTRQRLNLSKSGLDNPSFDAGNDDDNDNNTIDRNNIFSISEDLQSGRKGSYGAIEMDSMAMGAGDDHDDHNDDDKHSSAFRRFVKLSRDGLGTYCAMNATLFKRAFCSICLLFYLVYLAAALVADAQRASFLLSLTVFVALVVLYEYVAKPYYVTR